jgi:hypothetical protein
MLLVHGNCFVKSTKEIHIGGSQPWFTAAKQGDGHDQMFYPETARFDQGQALTHAVKFK